MLLVIKLMGQMKKQPVHFGTYFITQKVMQLVLSIYEMRDLHVGDMQLFHFYMSLSYAQCSVEAQS